MLVGGATSGKGGRERWGGGIAHFVVVSFKQRENSHKLFSYKYCNNISTFLNMHKELTVTAFNINKSYSMNGTVDWCT